MPTPEEIENETEPKGRKGRKKSREAVPAPKDETSVAFFLHSSLFVFFLTSFTFLLFLYKNKYPLILNNEILPEVLVVFGALFVLSFLALFIFSFSAFLSRVFLSVVTGALRLGRRSHAGGHRRDDLAVPGQHLLGGAVRFLAAGAGGDADPVPGFAAGIRRRGAQHPAPDSAG